MVFKCHIQAQELSGYGTKLLRRLAGDAHLGMLHAAEQLDQGILRPASHQDAIHRDNATVVPLRPNRASG
jgi:hypothetical protein